MTKSHNDRIKAGNDDYGYSIRVGTNVPANAVNLAYVHTPDISPVRNLLITDSSSEIVENKMIVSDTNTIVYPDNTFLLREINKPLYTMTKNLTVTDEFSVPMTGQEMPQPLYYQAEARGLFNAQGAMVTSYESGYIDKPIANIVDYSQIGASQKDFLLYLGGKIRITKVDGSAIPSSYKYKVKLVKQSTPANAYKIIIYTNFRGSDKEGFVLRYERYNADGSLTGDFTEVLNAYPFFTEADKSYIDSLASSPKVNGAWKSELQLKQYALSETDDHRWQIYAPSQVLVANNAIRPAQQFEYKIKGRLRTKMDDANPGVLNIGIVYINDSIPNGENLTGIIKKTFEHSSKPQYLDFVNPHPPDGYTKADQSVDYWTVDLTMPGDYLNDYDLIIFTGYGATDIGIYNDAIRTYLQNGGRIWIDNAGSPVEGTDVLTLNSFLTNITFSTTVEPVGQKIYAISDNDLELHDQYSLERRAMDRLHVMNKNNILIGYPNVNPKILFGFGEDPTLWTNIIIYQSNDPAVMTRRIYEEGTLIVSNCGIFRSLADHNADDIKLAMNMILAIAEEKTVNTPWIRDYVYNRDNLFKEEYKNGDHAIYVDDRSDIDSTQIVAKKILNKSVRDALIPYMPSSYYNSKGTFKVDVQADANIVVPNNDFEIGLYNVATDTAETQWAGTTLNAIPGWSVTYVSGINAVFRHISSLSERGQKAIQLNIPAGQTGGKSYWNTTLSQLPIGTYKASVWIKTSNVQGSGAELTAHKADGTLLTSSPKVLGTRDWLKIEITFAITTSLAPELRIGYVQGDSTGMFFADFVEVVNVGSIYMTPEGNGEQSLYAYSVRARGDVFDLKTEGFANTDVTVINPYISFYCMIKSFVYKWNDTLVKYVREYGNSSRTLVKLSRSDGMLNIGLLSTLVPSLLDGPEWADKQQIFFEVSAEPVDNNRDSEFVNLAFLNTQTGRYFYSEAGQDVIGYAELYDGNTINGVIVQGWTNYYTISATKRRYSVRAQADERIYLEYPATIDDRDSWFLRVHNGNFVKSALNYAEYDQFKDFYTNRQFGMHKYLLPEYDRQLFKPGQPFRRIRKEICEYVDDTTIKVQHAPLYVKSGQAAGEVLSKVDPANSQIFKAIDGSWLKTPAPKLYTDTGGNGTFIDYVGEYDIDYANGIVYLADPATGVIKVDYHYNNIEVFKRTYSNGWITREELQTTDKKVFYSANKNWLLYPNPTVYRLPEGKENIKDYPAPVNTYQIDYDAGEITFNEDVNDHVYIDYTYSVDKPMVIRDYDIQSGMIYLANPITFKDELYCNYYYEENFVEYRGYYDEEIGQFIHLDLNPTEGHYCTMPTTPTDLVSSQQLTKFDEVPTARLMNKQVYVYLRPYTSSFYSEPNQYAIRHCYSKAEWDYICSKMPGIAILLGIAELREHARVKDTTVLDTRTRGGGIKQSIPKNVMKKKDPLTSNFWDIGPWDGQAYYSNGVIVIQLPKSVLKTEGGQFSEKDIQEMLKKYVAYGIYPIIEYV